MKLLTRSLPRHVSLLVLALFLPVLAFAQSGGNFQGPTQFVGNILTFINGTLVPLVFAVAFLVFIWGVFEYFIRGGGDEGKREQGKQLMLWGIIGFVLMVSIWGIVNILSTGVFGTDQEIQRIPNAPTSR